MRVVGGIYRSRVLCEFSGEDIRPTSDKVKESLFNILGAKVYGCSFLDAFCGTGAIGIEAISRGANFVAFNDCAKTSRDLLKQNLAKLKIDGGYKITDFDGVGCFKLLNQKFDIIYIDPPYKTDLGIRALFAVTDALKDDGVVVFEDEKAFDGEVYGLKVVKAKKYGRIHLTFFEKEKI